MKRLPLWIVVVLSLTIVLTGQLSFAQEKKIAIGWRTSYNMYQESDDFLNSSYDEEFDDALGISADVTYFFCKTFALELSLGYLKTDMNLDFSGWDSSFGELTQIPLLLTGQYHFTAGEKVRLYAGLGIGYYLNDMDEGDFFFGAPSGVEAFADDALGYHVAAGMEYFLAENVALNLGLKYVWLDVDIGFDGAGYDEKESTSLNAFVTGVGVKYYF
jgi:outer membrane protein W